MSDIGHNSATLDGGHLKAFVERVERINSEISEKNEDKKELYQEIKSSGFDVHVLKKVVQLRRMDTAKRLEMETILDLYLSALGMV